MCKVSTDMWLIAALAACDGEPSSADLAGHLVASEPCDSCGGDCLLQTYELSEAVHLDEPLDYPDPPPTGGPHHSCWADWGVHDGAVPDDRWVHNLEHGGIV